MKTFITGATGFIGSSLVKRLAQTKHKMICLARESSDVRFLKEAGAIVFIGDVMDKDSLLQGMAGCDWVVNLANFYEFWTADPRVYHDVNVIGTRNVMEAALAGKVSKVMHVSTVAVFGNAAWPVTEASAMGTRCFGKYAKTKREGDLIAWELFKEKDLPLVVVYPGAVLGPNDPKATGRYIRNVLRKKMPVQVFRKSMFPFVHVRDVAEAIVRGLEREGNIGEKYLVVSENLTFGDINKTLADISGVKLPKLVLPDFMTMLGAYAMTGLANIFKKQPILDMAVDQMCLMKNGMHADGSKTARDLGFSYMPIREALAEQAKQ